MTNTPNLALPYPELSDTADVPRDIKALALKLDTILGGGGGGGGGGTLPLAGAPVLDVGRVGQVRAGHELAVADFTSLGLGTPAGLFNLSGLANLGSGGPLVNLGAVPFGVGINGLAATAAVFAGSTGQALYIVDTGAADPFRIRTGSFGGWFRTAKRGGGLALILSKWSATAGQQSYYLSLAANGVPGLTVSTTGSDAIGVSGLSDVCDDRWHHLVAVHDGTLLRLYVDAILEGAVAVGPIFPGSAPLNIGANAADGSTAAANPHYGRADETFVTPDVLTEDEIRLIYAAKLGHALGLIPTTTRLSIHRRRKGAALAVADFPAQPVRLHNFTGGALTDQGSGGVALAPVGGGSIVAVAGPDGTPQSAYSFAGAHTGLGATGAGLPGGVTPRSYGCWVKCNVPVSTAFVMAWAATGADIFVGASGAIASQSGADTMTGPFAADGQWHLVVVVEDNTAGDGVKRKLYLDGRAVAVSTVMNALTPGTANDFRIGAASNSTGPFIGQIDAPFVSAGVLTVGDIQALYAKGTQDLGASPKNAGDHVERMDATTVLFVGDSLESQHTVDLGVVA